MVHIATACCDMEVGMNMEKIWRLCTFVFTILTLIGGGYVLIHQGEVNVGYALIPSLLSVIFSQLSIAQGKRNQRNSE